MHEHEGELFDSLKFKQLKDKARQAVEGQVIDSVQFSDNQYEQEVFNLQKEKQIIMQQLKTDLSLIDRASGQLKGRGEINRDAQYNAQKDIFYIDHHGHLETITFSQLITDADYGIEYNLLIEQLSRHKLKRYIVARTQSKLRRLFDLQLLQAG